MMFSVCGLESYLISILAVGPEKISDAKGESPKVHLEFQTQHVQQMIRYFRGQLYVHEDAAPI